MEKLDRGRSTSSSPKSRRERKGFLSKTVERCRSLGRRLPPAPAPAGCFPVVVGPERERFFVRAERASHPVFRTLLDEAEAAYGFPGPGPLVLPCAAEKFRRVMAEMERDEEEDDDDDVERGAGSAPRSPAAWRFFSKGDAARAGYLQMR
ncbi:unnamed protein product [Urochloa decumbens]|uniref:Uncharacterized protein n=1 Tax=Urochloa decumbens TaxID=240449 RepID=A0ABC9F088_9POAL